MNAARFVHERVPALNGDLSRFSDILRSVPGFTTATVMRLLNGAVSFMDHDEIYCEVGCYGGSTLIGAMHENSDRYAVAIDNFSEFSGTMTLATLVSNVQSYLPHRGTTIHDVDFETILAKESIEGDALSGETRKGRIGVFFYDAAHDYRSTLIALLMVRPHLASDALIVVDDTNLLHVRQAVHDFMTVEGDVTLLLELPTGGNGVEPWWNGLMLLGWHRGSGRHPTAPVRIPDVVRKIYGIRDGQAAP